MGFKVLNMKSCNRWEEFEKTDVKVKKIPPYKPKIVEAMHTASHDTLLRPSISIG